MRIHACLATRITSRLFLLGTAAVATGCFIFGPSFPPITATKQVTASHEGTVTKMQVQTTLGNITISPSTDADAVTVEATITASGHDQQQADDRLAKTTVAIQDRGSLGILIKPMFPEPRHGNESADLTISIPEMKKIDITVDSSTGNIMITAVDGQTKAGTSTGDINVHDSKGPMVIDTSTGDVQIRQHVGNVEIDTSTGNIEIDQQSGGRVKADSSTGSIRITLADSGNGPVVADTSTDDIMLSVGSAFKGRVDLQAHLGLVTIKDPGNRVTSKAIEDSEGRIQIGEDGPTSSLDTSTGSITVTIRETMGESAAKTKQDQSAPQAP